MLVRVTQLVVTNELTDGEDRQCLPAGEHGKGSVKEYPVPDDRMGEQDALDWFHGETPIGCLDDFEIQVIFHEEDVVEVYGEYEITAAPAFQREYRFNFAHKEYMGPEDRRCGCATTIEDCKEQIDEIERELSVACASCGEDASRDAEDGLCDSCLKAREQHDIRMTDDPIYAAGVREREQADRDRDRGEWIEHYGH